MQKEISQLTMSHPMDPVITKVDTNCSTGPSQRRVPWKRENGPVFMNVDIRGEQQARHESTKSKGLNLRLKGKYLTPLGSLSNHVQY